jgi:ferritin-like metal-binding protein YciE
MSLQRSTTMAEPTIRELKLIQYLNEAYGKERELETALQAHIKMTTRDAYKKRLQAHLKETKGHARDVKARIKKLGGEASETDIPGPEVVKEVATGAQAVASKAIALAQGPLHALRGTSVAEKQLKNAKTEYASEAEEIAMYTAIESLADALADDETVKLARRIRRDEERMGTYLEKLIPSLTKAVVQEEIPAAERRPADGRRTASSRARSNGGRSRSGTSRASSGTSRASSGTSRSRSTTRARAKRA